MRPETPNSCRRKTAQTTGVTLQTRSREVVVDCHTAAIRIAIERRPADAGNAY